MIMILVILVAIVFAIPVVIFTIPVAFMHPPAFAIVIVMRMVPIRSFVGRTLPVPFHPSVAMPMRGPIPLDPDIAWAGNRRTPFVTQWRRRASDIDGNLCRSRDGESNCEQYSAYPIQFHSGLSRVLGFRVRNPSGELPTHRHPYPPCLPVGTGTAQGVTSAIDTRGPENGRFLSEFEGAPSKLCLGGPVSSQTRKAV